MTLKICTAYGTRTEVTQPEIVASLLIDTQERATMEKEKKITKRRMKIIKKIRDLKNPREGALGSRSKHQDKLAL
jgi:hypothetical protein